MRNKKIIALIIIVISLIFSLFDKEYINDYYTCRCCFFDNKL